MDLLSLIIDRILEAKGLASEGGEEKRQFEIYKKIREKKGV